MGKILGLDLGTNSIGWAIRTDTLEHNQIVDYGVTIFEAGMGMNKNGEFSRAAERRSNRSKRRLYNAKRYRKWATLKVLMENNMCPITEEELRLWSIGNWQDGKNKGRVYPSSPDFIAWLAMDFESIGKEKDESTKLKPAFENTYLLRSSLLENIDETDKNRLYKIGRACYHLVQRRGFKTSRKGGKSGYAKNEELEKLKVENPSIQISQILQNKLEIENKRIRASGVIQRKYFEDEFFAICEKQKIASQSTDKIYKAIYFVRPLRTQKGLVGTCTLEKGKTRIPISHPAFEEFRALSFINNIQWRETGSKNTFETIPMELKKKIFEFLFFKRNKKMGLVLDRTYFKFDDIIDEYSENGKREFNFRNKPNISTCPMIAGLINVFDDEWKDKFITDENKFGINWDGLYLSYEVKYGKKLGQKRNLNYEAIWHLLFDLIQTKDKEDTDIEKFCSEVFGWNEDKIKLFIKIDIQQGYGSLSKSAIDKINPFLKQAIEPKLKKWKDKVESLRKLIDDNKIRTKKIQDITAKNDSIRKRHLLQFELDYWDKKVKTFTLKEIPNWWKNSQLVDTQIITKYARAYMKTVFSKVDVQKGSITADFRKIYGIMGDEKKDRSKHSHHAKDAAILTLIPGSSKREDILKKYYSDTRNFRTIPYEEFTISHIQDIEETVLINHVKKDQTLCETKKKVRKRGEIVYLRDEKTKQFFKDENGKKIPMIMQGDSIRGGLHKDSYFGAIKISERNESGYVLKKNGKYILKQKDDADEIWIVKRKSINEINIDKDIVIDELLKKYIKKQIEDGSRIEEVVDFNGKSIRHLRCRVKAGVGFLSKEKAMPIKKHIFASKHEHKKEYLVQNEENYLFLMYEGENKKEEVIRGYKILNLFEIAKLGISSIDEIKKEPEFQKLQKGSGKNIIELKLKTIIKAGDKVIFYKEIKEELQELKLQELNKRVFKVLKFNELGPTTAYLYLQSHIEARPDGELEKGEKELIFDKYQPRLELTCDKLNCAIENIDFNIHSDGKIKWLF